MSIDGLRQNLALQRMTDTAALVPFKIMDALLDALATAEARVASYENHFKETAAQLEVYREALERLEMGLQEIVRSSSDERTRDEAVRLLAALREKP